VHTLARVGFYSVLLFLNFFFFFFFFSLLVDVHGWIGMGRMEGLEFRVEVNVSG
jgi:hypothetical protein